MQQTAVSGELYSEALLERAWNQHARMPQPDAMSPLALPQPPAMSLAPSAPCTAPAVSGPSPPLLLLPSTKPVVPLATEPVDGGRWPTAAVVACLGLASSLTAVLVVYQLRHHPRIQPILQPLLRALHFSSTPATSATSSTSSPPTVPSTPPVASPSLTLSTDAASSGSMITVDERQLIRLFHLSLDTLQTSGSIDGELEQALFRHLQSTAYPSPVAHSASSSSLHAALQFVAVQWLLLHCTLQLNTALSAEQYDVLQADILHVHMPLCWALLATIPETPAAAAVAAPPSDEAHAAVTQSALNLLRLDVAQRLHDPERMSAVFGAVWREKDAGHPWTVEEAVVLCTAAPHIGRWDEMLQLAQLIQQAGAAAGVGDGMQAFHESAQHRRDIVDYQVLMELARDEVERRQRVRESRKRKDTNDEQKEQQPSTRTTALTTPSSSLFSPLPDASDVPSTSLSACAWSEHILLACDSLYEHVRCSHPHLQQQAERIHQAASSYTPCPVLPSSSIRLSRLGCVLSLHSPLSPQLRCFGLLCQDGHMRLAGWREAEEGPGGAVRWREEWRMAEVPTTEGGRAEWEQSGGVATWEGERMVERLRRKYASDSDEEQVRVQWTWKVRLQLQMQSSQEPS